MIKVLCLFAIILELNAQVIFPDSYEGSRESFRKMISDKKGLLISYPIESSIDNNLSIDFGYFVPDQNTRNLIILSSGIHGPEGYLGSYAQKLFLKYFLGTIDKKNTGILIVHAINPYGFKYGRRVSEENIDLNRNMSLSKEIFRFKNNEHEKILDIIRPQRSIATQSMFSTLWGVFKKVITGTSVKTIRNGITSGQYEYEKSLYFGGKSFSKNRDVLLKVYEKIFGPYQNILSLDFHTGLGEQGQLHLISGDKTFLSKRSLELQKEIFSQDEKDFYKLTTAETPGFYPTSGDMNDFVAEIAGMDKNVVALTAEFGTMGLSLWHQLKTINRMIKENQGHHWGYENNSLERKVKMDFADTFYPKEKVWREKVKRRIMYLYKKPVNLFNKL